LFAIELDVGKFYKGPAPIRQRCCYVGLKWPMVGSFKVAVADLGGNDGKIVTEVPLGSGCL
jgi:hypothetical protein